MSSNDEKRGGRRYLPYAFTEQGVAMLSAVLRSETAVRVSVQIMDAFVEMRHQLLSNAALLGRVRDVETRQLELERSTDERFERVFDFMGERVIPEQRVFFDGQAWDAFELLVSLVQRAERELVLVDSYVDTATLSILSKKRDGVTATVWTHPRARLAKTEVAAFNAQHPVLEVRHTTSFHDRFLLLDGREGYLIGASLKDAGKRCFAVTRIEDEATVCDIMSRLSK